METLQVTRLPDPHRCDEFQRLQLVDDLETKISSWATLGLKYPQLEIRRAALLYGEPGTGKSTFARCFGSRWAEKRGRSALQVDANLHAIPSGERGGSQKNTLDFYAKVRELASTSDAIFLALDEVETCLANRALVNSETNPLDTLFAVNAVFEASDALVRECPNVLTIATTNLPASVDRAGLERFDLVEHVGPPDREGRLAILASGLKAIPGSLGLIKSLTSHNGLDPRLEKLTTLTESYSGRRLKQLIFHALVLAEGDREPLNLNHLVSASEKELESHRHQQETKGKYTYDWQ